LESCGILTKTLSTKRLMAQRPRQGAQMGRPFSDRCLDHDWQLGGHLDMHCVGVGRLSLWSVPLSRRLAVVTHALTPGGDKVVAPLLS